MITKIDVLLICALTDFFFIAVALFTTIYYDCYGSLKDLWKGITQKKYRATISLFRVAKKIQDRPEWEKIISNYVLYDDEFFVHRLRESTQEKDKQIVFFLECIIGNARIMNNYFHKRHLTYNDFCEISVLLNSGETIDKKELAVANFKDELSKIVRTGIDVDKVAAVIIDCLNDYTMADNLTPRSLYKCKYTASLVYGFICSSIIDCKAKATQTGIVKVLKKLYKEDIISIFGSVHNDLPALKSGYCKGAIQIQADFFTQKFNKLKNC